MNRALKSTTQVDCGFCAPTCPELTEIEKLGEGSFAEVWKATKEDGEFVAVKHLKAFSEHDFFNHDLGLEFKKEVDVLQKLGEHENICRFLECCLNPPKIIMEFVAMDLTFKGKPISSLRDYLHFLREEIEKDNSKAIDFESFPLQIANGMTYLEEKQIIHCDLAARNILIDKNCRLKISDFGLSKIQKDPFLIGSGVKDRNPRWLPPEAKKNFTSKGDIWSFAVVLWEIGTLGACPYFYFINDEVWRLLKEKKVLKKPKAITDHLYKVMTQCWNFEPTARPTFNDLKKLLDLKKSSLSFYDFEKEKLEFKKLPTSYLPPVVKDIDPMVTDIKISQQVPWNTEAKHNSYWAVAGGVFALLFAGGALYFYKTFSSSKGQKRKSESTIQSTKKSKT